MSHNRWQKPMVLLALLLVTLCLVAGCGSSPTETPVPPTAEPTATAESAQSPPANPTPGTQVSSGGNVQPLSERIEASLEHVRRMEDEVLATVDGHEITWEDYEPILREALLVLNKQHQVDWTDAAMQMRLWQVQNDVLKQVVDRYLLVRLAEEQGIDIPDEDFEAQVEHETQQILSSGQFAGWADFLTQNGLTQESFERTIYNVMLYNSFIAAQEVDREAEQLHLAHIVVNSEAAGQDVYAKLQAGEDFAALAAEFSIDAQTKDSGGDLGWFTEEIMSPEIGSVAYGLQVGDYSTPIQTERGYAIILLLGREVRELDARLLRPRQQEAVLSQLDAARAEADIEYLVDFTAE